MVLMMCILNFRISFRKIICLIGCFLFSLILVGQDTVSMTVDRPGIADLPYLVQQGQFQVESGIEFTKRHHFVNYNIPNLLFRMGIAQQAEIRIGAKYVLQDSLQQNSEQVKPRTGLLPLSIGLKIPFIKQKGIIPDIALLTNIVLPSTFKKEFNLNYTGHEIYLLFNNNLTRQWSLNYNLGSIWNGEDTQPTWLYAVCLSYQMTEKTGIFIENYGYLSDNPTEIGLDGGITYLASPAIQLDFSAGISQTEEKYFYFLGGGASFRIDIYD